jgi:hypothetical protein
VEHIGWFNHDRFHEALGEVPPAEFEALHAPRWKPATPMKDRRNQNTYSRNRSGSGLFPPSASSDMLRRESNERSSAGTAGRFS